MSNDTAFCAISYRPLAAGLLASAIAIPGLSIANINIVFDYSFDQSSFFSESTEDGIKARALMEDVATFYETHIEDDLTAIESGSQGSYNVSFFNPSTGVQQNIFDFDVPADTLIIYTGARDLDGNILGQGGPGGYAVSGTPAFVTNAVTRGETPTSAGTQGPTATDFAPWGGSIVFDFDGDASDDWYFDTDPSTDEGFGGLSDFYSVALHEVGHVLGYGTSDSWANQIDFGNGTFTGANAVAANGGNPVPLADSAHWRDNTTISPIFGTMTDQEAAMDPTLTVGTRKRYTELDMAGLADIGWEIASASAQ